MGFRLFWAAVLCFIAFCLSLPFILWLMQEETPMRLTVIDKTVPKEDYREHLGLFWTFEHRKIVKDDGTYYRLDEDYYGYHPYDAREDDKMEIPENPDLIYVADTYGVYAADMTGNVEGQRSGVLYGGLTIFEWNRIMAAKTPDTTLIMEFNSLASPTDALTRSIVEQNMRFRWTGWIARYFPDLQSEEVPMWMMENYEAQYERPWDFTGPGIAFIDETDRVVVMTEEHYSGRVEFERTEVGKEAYPDVSDSHYGYWFDIIVPDESLSVDAVYTVDWNENGLKTLQENGIPTEFPAILRSEERRQYYFAGDFADVQVKYFAKWRLPELFYDVMALVRTEDEFFWRSYIPLMKNILER